MNSHFTDTGNSLYAVKVLDSECRSISQIMNSGNHTFEAEKIGIICPVYGHEMPKMVRVFLRASIFHTAYLFADNYGTWKALEDLYEEGEKNR